MATTPPKCVYCNCRTDITGTGSEAVYFNQGEGTGSTKCSLAPDGKHARQIVHQPRKAS